MDTSFSINHSDINKYLVSEDEEDNESFNFPNFTSSSEWLSKLCTTDTRWMNNEDPKSPPEFTPESSRDISEMQKESFASIMDDTFTSLPSSSSLSENEGHKERKSSIYLSIEQPNSENEEMGEKRQEIPAPKTKSTIYLSVEQEYSKHEEKDEKRQENEAHEDRKSSIYLSIERETSERENEAHEDRKCSIYLIIDQQTSQRENEAHEDINSSIHLSIDQQNSKNEDKKGKKRRSRFRRILSSCRRGLSRVARAFACCTCRPSTI
ncbi:uncharacterized protein [Dendrobates tinctorius]|uniref:uncharacterized protein isoform X1 n=1 Tax=Dendrobates tinctorius TaxID=92724 RepID=UPI003CC9F070